MLKLRSTEVQWFGRRADSRVEGVELSANSDPGNSESRHFGTEFTLLSWYFPLRGRSLPSGEDLRCPRKLRILQWRAQ